jgi:dGTPase
MCSTGFVHSEQSVRIVEKLEKGGQGLNLTWEVRDGIRNHQTEGHPATPEGQIVRLSDKIAYVNSDVDDAIRAQILTEESIPMSVRKTLGMTSAVRLDTLIHDVIISSQDSPEIKMSPEIAEAMKDLRDFMFANVYKDSIAKVEEVKAKRMIRELFEYYQVHFDELPDRYRAMEDDGETQERIICDYISGMTDQYCITKFNEYFMPKAWIVDGF